MKFAHYKAIPIMYYEKRPLMISWSLGEKNVGSLDVCGASLVLGRSLGTRLCGASI